MLSQLLDNASVMLSYARACVCDAKGVTVTVID